MDFTQSIIKIPGGGGGPPGPPGPPPGGGGGPPGPALGPYPPVDFLAQVVLPVNALVWHPFPP